MNGVKRMVENEWVEMYGAKINGAKINGVKFIFLPTSKEGSSRKNLVVVYCEIPRNRVFTVFGGRRFLILGTRTFKSSSCECAKWGITTLFFSFDT